MQLILTHPNHSSIMKMIVTAAVALISVCASFSSPSAKAGVLLDTDFSNSTLYPSGKALGTVADGLGAWAFSGAARAVSLDGGKSGIRMTDTGTSYYNFSDTYTTGKITVEFSIIPYVANSVFEISLGNGTANGNIGPQLRFGQNAANDISYYDGSKFVTIPGISFTIDVVNTFTFTANLSGEHAGKFDLYFNGELVAENLIWRNNLSSLTNLRARSVSSGPNVDLIGLKITAVPEPSSVAFSLTALLLFGGISRHVARRMAS